MTIDIERLIELAKRDAETSTTPLPDDEIARVVLILKAALPRQPNGE